MENESNIHNLLQNKYICKMAKKQKKKIFPVMIFHKRPTTKKKIIEANTIFRNEKKTTKK